MATAKGKKDTSRAQVSKALDRTPGSREPNYRGKTRGGQERTRARRLDALALRIQGKTWAEIGRELKVSPIHARNSAMEILRRAENEAADEMRAIENRRLDIAQNAIWEKVEEGSLAAIETFLKVSKARREINGLDAPHRVAIAGDIRIEMESALAELENVLLQATTSEDEGEVVDAEVVESDEHSAA